MSDSHELGPLQERGLEMARRYLDKQVQNPGWDGLVAVDGQNLPGSADERLAALQDASKAWDSRAGLERQDIGAQAIDDPDSQESRETFAAADQLGMVESSRPRNTRPAYLVVLGGGNRSAFYRTAYALESVEDFGTLVFLGSGRSLSNKERDVTHDVAPNARDEFDLGCAAIEALPGARLVQEFAQERNGEVWRTREYEFDFHAPDGTVVRRTAYALSTPRTVSGRRATTYDNWRFFAAQAELQPGDETSIVAVTTAHYVPGQQAPAVQEITLPYGIQVETIGHDAPYGNVVRLASQLRQEAKSAVDALVRLSEAIKAAEQPTEAAEAEPPADSAEQVLEDTLHSLQSLQPQDMGWDARWHLWSLGRSSVNLRFLTVHDGEGRHTAHVGLIVQCNGQPALLVQQPGKPDETVAVTSAEDINARLQEIGVSATTVLPALLGVLQRRSPDLPGLRELIKRTEELGSVTRGEAWDGHHGVVRTVRRASDGRIVSEDARH